MEQVSGMNGIQRPQYLAEVVLPITVSEISAFSRISYDCTIFSEAIAIEKNISECHGRLLLHQNNEPRGFI